jgi:hypothetical protein
LLKIITQTGIALNTWKRMVSSAFKDPGGKSRSPKKDGGRICRSSSALSC